MSDWPIFLRKRKKMKMKKKTWAVVGCYPLVMGHLIGIYG
jgi:hypothetical protein